MMRQHHWIVFALTVLAVVVIAMTFKARQAAGQLVYQYLPFGKRCAHRKAQRTGEFTVRLTRAWEGRI